MPHIEIPTLPFLELSSQNGGQEDSLQYRQIKYGNHSYFFDKIIANTFISK